MQEIIVLGAGAMGTAFCFPLADARNRVALVGTHLDGEWINAMKTTGKHPKLRTAMPETVNYFFHDELSGLLTDETRLIVLGINSAGVTWATEQLISTMKKPVPILMLTKGLAVENDRLSVLPDVVQNALTGSGIQKPLVAAVAGPCIAAELAARRDSSVVFASQDKGLLNELRQMALAPYYHIRQSTDLIGVEVCAALKNFYTLAIGSPVGRLEGSGQTDAFAQVHNLTAGLFTQALEEMAYVVSRMGGTSETVHGLCGSGDLYVTCLAGRNSRMGKLLGRGIRYSQAKSQYMAEDTVEGAELALTIGPVMEQLMTTGVFERSRLPLAGAIIDAILKDRPLEFSWKDFYQS